MVARSLMGRALLRGMMSGFSHISPSTILSGSDVRNFPHAVSQRSDWPVAEALNFPNEKFLPVRCVL